MEACVQLLGPKGLQEKEWPPIPVFYAWESMRGSQRVTVLDVVYNQKRYLRKDIMFTIGAYSTLFNNLYDKKKIEKT